MITVTVTSRLGEPTIATQVGNVAASVDHALHLFAFGCPLCGDMVTLQGVQHGFVATNLDRADEPGAVRIEAQLQVDPVPLWRHLDLAHGVRWLT